MPQHIGDLYRTGLTNFTGTETNATSLQINGTPRNGVWIVASHQGVTGGVNQVGTLHATAGPSAGVYQIVVGGQTTVALAYNASTTAILAAIYGLTNVVLNNVRYPTVPLGAITTPVVATGYAAGDVPITFQNAWGNQPITMTLVTTGLTATTPVVTNATTGVGVTCAITAQGNDDNGTTWIAIPHFGTLYVPASPSSPGAALLETGFKYVSFTATFGGSGTNLKNLQVGLRTVNEGVN